MKRWIAKVDAEEVKSHAISRPLNVSDSPKTPGQLESESVQRPPAVFSVLGT